MRDLKEIKELVSAIEDLDALYENEETDREELLQHHPDFIRLKELINKQDQ